MTAKEKQHVELLTAKEMFEKLGYTCERSDETAIIYRYYTNKQISYSREIGFWLKIKEYCANPTFAGLFIDSSTHKAIHKQIEELGWLEE